MVTDQRYPLTVARRGFTFKWWGGEYLEISKGGSPFEVINMSPAEGNGHLPPFTLQVFLDTLDELTDDDYAGYRTAYRESKV